VFISEPHDGVIFIAERSRRGSRKLLWSSMPVVPITADVRPHRSTGGAEPDQT
jgi:hypothetical protein